MHSCLLDGDYGSVVANRIIFVMFIQILIVEQHNYFHRHLA